MRKKDVKQIGFYHYPSSAIKKRERKIVLIL